MDLEKDYLSTVDATYKLADRILQAWNNKANIGIIFCDLSTAFYSVNHKVLFQNSKFYGIQVKLLGWFESYLSGRKQRIVWNSHYTQNCFLSWDIVSTGSFAFYYLYN